MRKNVMSEVARALGVELLEVFAVCNSVDNSIEYMRLTKDGLEHFLAEYHGNYTHNGHKGRWSRTDIYLEPLLTGKIWIRDEIEQGVLFDEH